MGVKSGDVRCAQCGAVIPGETAWTQKADKKPCPRCNATKRIYSMEIRTTTRILPLLAFKAKGIRAGRSTRFYEFKEGYNYFKKTGAWHWILQIADRDNDYYRKFVRDVASGKVIKDQTERLRQHIPDRVKRNRGSNQE